MEKLKNNLNLLRILPLSLVAAIGMTLPASAEDVQLKELEKTENMEQEWKSTIETLKKMDTHSIIKGLEDMTKLQEILKKGLESMRDQIDGLKVKSDEAYEKNRKNPSEANEAEIQRLEESINTLSDQRTRTAFSFKRLKNMAAEWDKEFELRKNNDE